eukprot:scaffold25261_cov39-Isochrysis_galbana.AAC.1
MQEGVRQPRRIGHVWWLDRGHGAGLNDGLGMHLTVCNLEGPVGPKDGGGGGGGFFFGGLHLQCVGVVLGGGLDDAVLV